MDDEAFEGLIPTVPFSVELEEESLIQLGFTLFLTATLVFVAFFAIRKKMK